jgi:hypothetical protein
MSAVVERLRASKETQEAAGQVEGLGHAEAEEAFAGNRQQAFLLGSKWAEERADFQDLQTLFNSRESVKASPNMALRRFHHERVSQAHALACDIGKLEVIDKVGKSQFWRDVIGIEDAISEEVLDGREFAEAFADGALAVWSAVKDKI